MGQLMQDSHHRRCTRWILAASNVTYQSSPLAHGNTLPNFRMQERLATGPRRAAVVRAAFYFVAGERRARKCAGRRRWAIRARTQREIMRFITEKWGEAGRVATSGLHLTDDLKARILSTFLTLMNLRENLDRASMRSSYGRHPVSR